MTFKVKNQALGTNRSVGRYIIMFCIYVGFSCFIYSVLTLQHPSGPEYASPISVTMQCGIGLTFQFFFIYLMPWVFVIIKEFTGSCESASCSRLRSSLLLDVTPLPLGLEAAIRQSHLCRQSARCSDSSVQ